MTHTQQVNFRLSPEHAQLVRLFVQLLREGGPSYEREVRLFVLQPYPPDYGVGQRSQLKVRARTKPFSMFRRRTATH